MKIRILDHSWHLAHQHDQIKATREDIDWTWLIQHRRGYNFTPRGDFLKEFGVEQVPYYESGKYDLAILHLDQQCLDDILFERGKGKLFNDLQQVITDIPKLTICHGTPYWPEKFSDIEMCHKMKDLIGKGEMLCNSYTAKYQWCFGLLNARRIIEKLKEDGIDYRYATDEQVKNLGIEEMGVPFSQITTIWHGIDSSEYPVLPKEPRVVTMVSAGGLDEYYDRTFLEHVKEALAEKDIALCHITVDAIFKNFQEYTNFLGRSLILFNPTRESPMPRSRTEAMLCGCCVVTTPHQDANTYIENGKNGFIVPRNVETTVNLIEALITEYKTAEAIGLEGRKTAIEIFNPERYRKEFLELVNRIINNTRKTAI